jgi:hypothetical protein
MRRLLCGVSVVVAGVAAATAPAHAGPIRFPVQIVAHTDFTTVESQFDANLPGCESGTVVNGGGGPHFTPWGGVFAGDKVFTCAGGEAGFTIRLNARFGPGGSTGTWTVATAWGGLAGMKGSGSLVGIGVSETILDDIYTGNVR